MNPTAKKRRLHNSNQLDVIYQLIRPFGQLKLMINLHHAPSMCVDSDNLSMNFHIKRFSGSKSEKEVDNFSD